MFKNLSVVPFEIFIMTKATLEDAKQFLHMLDEVTNFCDTINIEVFKKLFTEELNRTLTDVHINNIFKDGINEEGNGKMDFNEFIAVFAFVMYDTNGNEHLDQSEVKQLVSVFFELDVSDEDVQNGVDQLDKNGDGKICYIELRKFLIEE